MANVKLTLIQRISFKLFNSLEMADAVRNVKVFEKVLEYTSRPTKTSFLSLYMEVRDSNISNKDKVLNYLAQVHSNCYELKLNKGA